jgi:hypothetical protein
MSPLAICSSTHCSFRLRLQNSVNETTVLTPSRCPRCGESMMTFCPVCGFPLTVNLHPEYRCEVCQSDLRRAFVRKSYPPWMTQARLDSMIPPDWITPYIRRTDGKSFYLVLANLPDQHRPRRNSASTDCSSCEFWYVREDTVDTIESVAVLLTQPPRFFAMLESQLRRTADLLADRLTSGSLLSSQYEFDGLHLTEIRLRQRYELRPNLSLH